MGGMILRDEESGALAAIRPECGGTVDDIRLRPARAGDNGRRDGGASHDDPVSVVAGDPSPPSPAALDQTCDTELFRGRILAPWNDRIPAGSYRFANTEHRLTINNPEDGDAIHGFLYRLPLKICTAGDTGTAHTAGKQREALLRRHLRPSDEPGYPHNLDVVLGYSLTASSFTLRMEVKNTGDAPAPLALGWHPYFRLPGSLTVDDLKLELGAEMLVPVGSDLLPLGGHKSISDPHMDFRTAHAIGRQALDVAYWTPAGHTTRLTDGRLLLEITQSELFQYTQLFIPPDRRSIAIEPVSAATNAFNVPALGLRVLEPGQSVEGTVTVMLSEIVRPSD